MKEMYRNIGKLFSANVIAQAVGLLIYPILTRMYSPEDFGLLNLFMSIGGLLIIPATAQYQYAVSLSGKEDESRGAFHAGLICLVGSCLVLCLLPIFSNTISSWFKTPDLARYIWLMPVYICFLGLWNMISHWYVRHKDFDHISRYQVAQNLLSAGIKVGLGALAVVGGLLYGGVGAVVLAGLGTIVVGWNKRIRSLWPCNKETIRNAFHRFRNYPLFAMPSALVNAVNCNIAIWLIAPFFGLADTGYWGMAMLLAFTPISLIADSIYKVLLQNTSMKVNAGQKIGDSFLNYIKQCAWITGPFFAILYATMPWLVKLLLGEGWDETAYMIRCFLPWFFLLCFSLPWSFIPYLFEKQKINLYIEAGMLLSRLLVIGLGIYLHSIHIATVLYSIVSAVVVLIQFIWFGNLVKRHDNSCQTQQARD